MVEKETAKSITLPESIQVFRNLKTAKRFAIDIGNTLVLDFTHITLQHDIYFLDPFCNRWFADKNSLLFNGALSHSNLG